MLVQDGRSRYLGPTAGSEWLKDSEMREASESPLPTRLPSPAAHQSIEPPRTRDSFLNSTPNAFPFNTSPDRVRTKDLLAELPPRDEAWSLVESHYRYCAWHHDVAPREMFEPSFDRVYSQASGKPNSPQTNAQEIALVFIILAQGTIFNIELPSFDPSVEEWLRLSELALVKGHFLSNNTIPGLQTLHLMAHLHLHLDQGRRGDNAWPLWGLVMRLVQAMGIHRDGGRWNLPADVIEHRRKIFWECNTADIFQAHCFSRPSALNPEHYDTEFPSQPSDFGDAKSYSTARFELAQISSDIDFESALPFYIRCRAALLAMPSRYVQVEKAIEASPEPSRRSMKLSFQIIVAIVADIHARFPAVSTRQWNFWFHVFNSALCLGTLVLRDPGNAMAAFALDKIDSAVNLFHSLTRHGGGSPRSHRNLQWLINLRSRASTSINAVTPPVPRDLTVNVGIQNENSRTGEDVDAFLGWRTRLIERSCQGRPSVSREIVSTTPATPRGSGQPPATDFDSFYDALNAGGASHQTVAQSNAVAPDATDDLLHDFWDPLLLQEFMDPTSHDNQNNSNAAMNWGGNTDTVGPSGTQTHHSGKDILQQT
ncbi:hypothetical protein KC357_g7687 [Hortaea werneckii]|nr:hypothetical protein KC357_g7687 [Hortaea werneckii]